MTLYNLCVKWGKNYTVFIQQHVIHSFVINI